VTHEVLADWWEMHDCMCPPAKDCPHTPDMVRAWLCDTCGQPFVPKHWEDRYTTCQQCHYAA
jgi:hypothetical protein